MLATGLHRDATHVLLRPCCRVGKALVNAVHTPAWALPRSQRLPSDIEPETGLCADGWVRITTSLGKGLGAFATRGMQRSHPLDRYMGEVLTISEFHARYGGPEVDIAEEDAEWHWLWSQDRQRRGVGVTGQYVFAVGSCPTTSRFLFLDAEEPEFSNWTRFINHCEAPNVHATKLVTEDGVPTVFFSTSRAVLVGEELLLDYGPGYGEWLQRNPR